MSPPFAPLRARPDNPAMQPGQFTLRRSFAAMALIAVGCFGLTLWILGRWPVMPYRTMSLLITVMITLLLLLIESPSYYAEKGSTTGKHYGPITCWLTGWQ